MHGAASAVTSHAYAARKDNPRRSKYDTIEASDLAVITSASDVKEKEEDTIEDPDYNVEQDRLYMFPPPKFHKGDISLGVLMSG